MNAVLAVAAGGALGSVGRYLVSRFMLAQFGPGFPVGTLIVNAVGGLAIGALAGLFASRWPASLELRAFLVTGILGGFTTFSAFSLEVVELWTHGARAVALAYLAASLILSIGGVVLGLALAAERS